VITVRDVQKIFRQGDSEVRALAGVSLDIPDGDFVSIVGPSGSGKSTLLHLMGGLDAPTAGEIEIQGTALSRMSDDDITIFRRRRIGFVFQFFNLLPTYSAEENVGLPLVLDRRPGREVRERVTAALEQVGLAHRRRHRPDELSGGEMQRVAVARALVADPEAVLCDEPTGNLDTATSREILSLLSKLPEPGKRAVIMVTHDPTGATYGTRLVKIRDGLVEADEPVVRR